MGNELGHTPVVLQPLNNVTTSRTIHARRSHVHRPVDEGTFHSRPLMRHIHANFISGVQVPDEVWTADPRRLNPNTLVRTSDSVLNVGPRPWPQHQQLQPARGVCVRGVDSERW
jgi:hypothetical protein